MGEWERRRRRIRGTRGAYVPTGESPPAGPPARGPVDASPPQEPPAPEATTAPVERPTPGTARLGLRTMFRGAPAKPGPVPPPSAGPPSAGSTATPPPAERTRPPARSGFGVPALDREPIDAHAVAPGSEDHERGLRGLIGGGASQVSVTAAMRARDAARPTAEDIAAAEASLTIVHRGWVPRDP